MLDLQRILVDGGQAALGFLGLVLAVTIYNPRLWLNPRDVPPDIYAAAAPQSERERLVARLLLIPLFMILVIPPLVSTLGLAHAHPESSLLTLAAHAFLVLLLPALADLLIIDWLLLNTLTPDFVVIDGTRGLPGYKDHAFHLRAHLKLLPLQLAGALLIALIAAGAY